MVSEGAAAHAWFIPHISICDSGCFFHPRPNLRELWKPQTKLTLEVLSKVYHLNFNTLFFCNIRSAVFRLDFYCFTLTECSSFLANLLEVSNVLILFCYFCSSRVLRAGVVILRLQVRVQVLQRKTLLLLMAAAPPAESRDRVALENFFFRKLFKWRSNSLKVWIDFT